MSIRKASMAAILPAFIAAAALAAGDNALKKTVDPAGGATATFAGGCFWCMEEAFEKLPGVASVVSGYTGGKVQNPTYEQVSDGGTGHAEVIRVVYDPRKIGYDRLLEAFWRNTDPTVRDRQFCDVGSQYRPAIFYHDEGQRMAAMKSKAELEKSKPFKASILTEITPAGAFYAAEEYHQDYYKKNPLRYKFYKTSCGREKRLQELWGDKAAK
jgi:peptide-methionine (S)-S-oxide reductase